MADEMIQEEKKTDSGPQRLAMVGQPNGAAPAVAPVPPIQPRPVVEAAAGAAAAATAAPAAAETTHAPAVASDGSEPPAKSVDPVRLEGQVIEILRTVFDPEIPVNIYELGM